MAAALNFNRDNVKIYFYEMKKFPVLLFLTLLMVKGSAQTEKIQEMDSVTVSATIVPVKAAQTGRSITTVSAEEIKKLPAQTIDELLRYLPGVEVQARGPKGSQSDILIRGGTFQQVLIIIDGVRVNDPVTGHFNGYFPIATAEIERIEILRGASSALYGSDAVGGVVQIITKTFAGTNENKSGSATLSLGEYNYLNTDIGLQHKIGKWNFAGGAMGNNSSGVQQRGMRGFFHNYTTSFSAAVKANNNWNLGFRLAYDSRDFGAQNFYTSFASDSAIEKVNTFWSQAQARWSRRKLLWVSSAGYKSTHDNYLFNKMSIANNNKSSLIQAQSYLHYTFNTSLGLTAGMQIVNKGIKSNDRGNHHLTQVGFYTILNSELSKHFTLHPALRVEYDSKENLNFLPQLNASLHFSKAQLRGTVGRTIRDADFTERYNNYAKLLVTGGRIGNPDLHAETAWTYELGVDVIPINHLKISGTVFQRNQSKMIDYVPTPYSEMPNQHNLSPTGSYALALNISSVTNNGWELFVQWKRNFSQNHSLVLQAGATGLNSKLPDGSKPGLYLSNHANFLGNLMTAVQLKKLSISVSALYKKRPSQEASGLNTILNKDYFLLNTRIGFLITHKMNLFMQVDNVGNTFYTDLLGAQMPGRWVMGGVTFSFF